MTEKLSCFKAYDVRGRVPDQLNADIAYRIGRAYGEIIKPKKVVVGHDIRLSSEDIKRALADGLMDSGAGGDLFCHFLWRNGRWYCCNRQP